MKQFQYNLDTVLDYKTQILDNLKAEHAAIISHVNQKQEEIEKLNQKMNHFQDGFNQTKTSGAPIERFRLYDMCIGRMEEIIDEERQQLNTLKKKENEKKKEVVTAKVDTTKFEKLKVKRFDEYRKAEMKAEEAFVEEFVNHTMIDNRHQNRG